MFILKKFVAFFNCFFHNKKQISVLQKTILEYEVNLEISNKTLKNLLKFQIDNSIDKLKNISDKLHIN